MSVKLWRSGDMRGFDAHSVRVASVVKLHEQNQCAIRVRQAALRPHGDRTHCDRPHTDAIEM